MGTSAGGVAFRSSKTVSEIMDALSALFFNHPVSLIPSSESHDTRETLNVALEVFDDVYFLYNTFLVGDILEDHAEDASKLYMNLGKPQLMIAFSCFDSGDCYGYAYIEEGVRTRTRLVADGVVAVDAGEPKALEAEWFSSGYFLAEKGSTSEEWPNIYRKDGIELSEQQLTSHLLAEAMVANFGVCGWDTDRLPQYYCLEVGRRPAME